MTDLRDQPTTVRTADGVAAGVPRRVPRTVRTAVVVVHGMGEQLPVETLDRFVGTALRRTGGRRFYYSRPARLADSFEARRHLAPEQKEGERVVQGQTEFFEYHWSYLMTGNKLADLVPTVLRLMFRRPSSVPSGLRVVWRLVWLLALLLLIGVVAATIVGGVIDDWSFAGIVTGLLGSGAVAALVLWGFKKLGGVVTQSFVDVVRYLDRSPRSYEARRAIRTGMVDLLRAIHDDQRYSRIVVVAHSLGAFIAYDGITALWPDMSKLHCGPVRDDGRYADLPRLPELERAAERVRSASGADREAALAEFRQRQRDLWVCLRVQGNPWLVTDFVSVGTPMYFAHLLHTKNRTAFDRLVQRAELPTCPPVHKDQSAEGGDPGPLRYGWNNRGRTVLAHGAPFAVVRWTNLWFPAEGGFHGDWFGGPLAPLFGGGILDRPLLGNLPGRRGPGVAHSRYFDYPDDEGPDDVATVLRGALDLGWHDTLDALRQAPRFDERTRWTQ